MRIFAFTEARQKLASLLEQAAEYGEVRIKRRDGQVFVIKPEKRQGSPLAVEGIKLNSVNHRFNRSGDFSRSFATGKPAF